MTFRLRVTCPFKIYVQQQDTVGNSLYYMLSCGIWWADCHSICYFCLSQSILLWCDGEDGVFVLVCLGACPGLTFVAWWLQGLWCPTCHNDPILTVI